MKTATCLLVCLLCISAHSQSIPFSFFAATSHDTYGDYPINTLCGLNGFVCTTLTGATEATVVGTIGHPTTLEWGWVETCQAASNNDTDPCYNWTALEKVFDAAQSHNVPVAITLGWTPSWAVNSFYTSGGLPNSYCPNPGLHSTPQVYLCSVPPDDVDASGGSVYWKNFVQALMAHFGPSSTYASVKKYYETWNEASGANFWYLAQCLPTSTNCLLYDAAHPTGVNVTDYGTSRLATMARIHYMASKSSGTNGHGWTIADPNATILAPSATGPVQGGSGNIKTMKTWLDAYLAAANVYGTSSYCTSTGGLSKTSPVCADGVVFHGYLDATGQRPWPEGRYVDSHGNWFGPTSQQMSEVRASIHAYDSTDAIPLYDTEGSFGEGDLQSNGSNSCPSGDFSCDTAWLARWYVIQAGAYAPTSAGGEGLHIASWFDWGDEVGNPIGWGIIKQTNSDPTEAGVAYGWVTKWLTNNTVTPAAPATYPSADFWQANIGYGGNSAAAKIAWYCGDHTNTPPICTWDPTTTGSWTVNTSIYDHYQDLGGAIHTIVNPLPVTMKPVIMFKGATPPWCAAGGCL
jgi:hypothetical protein